MESEKNKNGRPKVQLTNEACYSFLKTRENHTIEEMAEIFGLKPRTISKYIRIAKDRALAGELDYIEEIGDDDDDYY